MGEKAGIIFELEGIKCTEFDKYGSSLKLLLTSQNLKFWKILCVTKDWAENPMNRTEFADKHHQQQLKILK